MTINELMTSNIDPHNIENALVLFFRENDQIATNVIARLMNDNDSEFIISTARSIADAHNEEVKDNLRQRQEEINKIRNS